MLLSNKQIKKPVTNDLCNKESVNDSDDDDCTDNFEHFYHFDTDDKEDQLK